MVFRFPLALIRFILLIIISLFFAFFGSILFLITKNSVKVSTWVVKIWGYSALILLNIKVNLSGSIPKEPALLMSNHRGYIDIFILLAKYPASIVGKKELAKWPILGQATKLGRMILVDRSNTGSLLKTMTAIGKQIKNGYSVIVFPEGTTHKGPLTKNFKGGAFSVAAQADVPILPCALNFSDPNNAWIDDDLFIPHFFRQMGKFRTHTQLWFGPLIKDSDGEKLKQRTREIIDSKLSEFTGIK